MFVPVGRSEEDQTSNARVFRQGLEILSLLFRYASAPAAIFAADRGRPSGYGYDVIYPESLTGQPCDPRMKDHNDRP